MGGVGSEQGVAQEPCLKEFVFYVVRVMVVGKIWVIFEGGEAKVISRFD
jgi:hypothetical protein